jgi:hypothetical protein
MAYVKIDKADELFSIYIRSRDGWCCQRCGGNFGLPTKGDKNRSGLHCSHFHGRKAESTRFDPRNCDALCYGCHIIYGSTNREAYRQFKINQLGQVEFDRLHLKSITTVKKDRKLMMLVVIKLLKSLPKNQVPDFIIDKYL